MGYTNFMAEKSKIQSCKYTSFKKLFKIYIHVLVLLLTKQAAFSYMPLTICEDMEKNIDSVINTCKFMNDYHVYI